MDLEGGWGNTSSPVLMAGSPVSFQDTSQILIAGDPKMLPPQFGFQAKMDHIDRRLTGVREGVCSATQTYG
ncbi:hypothetical protein LB505_006365 [Fusarium chuoi]|nr:hypothetical protein LB505_006365 [Fusarium chuoi]